MQSFFIHRPSNWEQKGMAKTEIRSLIYWISFDLRFLLAFNLLQFFPFRRNARRPDRLVWMRNSYEWIRIRIRNDEWITRRGGRWRWRIRRWLIENINVLLFELALMGWWQQLNDFFYLQSSHLIVLQRHRHQTISFRFSSALCMPREWRSERALTIKWARKLRCI